MIGTDITVPLALSPKVDATAELGTAEGPAPPWMLQRLMFGSGRASGEPFLGEERVEY